ncbi:NADP-dependent oxidoreductase [Rhizobium hidalgonense]|uniref:NADP-dependent oxidoreductase n=1 Tax=Rhizobium hidalgonense TaxID=1538159 RepID=A0AAJ2GVY5_9HYPH|nr:NADP-dependent oxidoreductase [Rhizobium hidalgonense]MDR9776932.1 NADP-dependent oxidoreductase [Rhizobium hidalgonense]MDR9814015.1 NADP-dependent oxidoreductase [Rhizobium hidalgonense]MDR9820665.1 NADP-dependent oxidoreductase [Rhizobium hidalgonense]
MKAVQFHRFGGPDVLQYEDAPKPQITEKDVLVRVHAVGLNPPDWYLREGFKALTPEWRPKVDFPAIAGTDISGVVEAVGDDVSGFSVGDEVYSMVRFPSGLAGGSRGYAEYVAVSPSELAHKPKGIDHVRAAAAPMSLLTAWQFLIDVGHDESNPLQPHRHKPVPLEGKTVLVNGAAGGVGHFALQLAKWRGAHVIAVASGKNEALLRDLGADKFIDYTRQAPEDVVREVDLVVDGVGGPKSGRFLRTLKRGGTLFPIFSLGFEGADEARERGVTVSTTQVRSSGTQLEEIAPLLSDGTIKVVIDGTYLLEQASDAHARAEQGHIQGKIVLTVR